MLQLGHNKCKVTLFGITDHFSHKFLKRHMKYHMANFLNDLGHRKYFFEQNLSIENPVLGTPKGCPALGQF